MDDASYVTLRETAREIRCHTLESIGRLGVGHIGGSLSIVEVLALLYFRHMDVDPAEPRRRVRDQLVLSKGHAGPALYSTLALRGFFPLSWLVTLNEGGTRLPSHCDRRLTPGIDMSTGSLGQGISAAVGMALGNRLDGIDRRVYVIVGDGECNEGQVWEAAQAAAHFRLNRLIGFTDCNKMQIDGYTKDIMGTEDLAAKWRAFGWTTRRVDGHDLSAVDAAIAAAREASSADEGPPSMIVLDTVKGKGADFAEGNLANHNMVFDLATARAAIARLRAEAARA